MAFGGAETRRDRATRHGDLRVADVVLGVIVATLAIGGSLAAVASAATAPRRAPSSILAPGEIVVEVRPTELPPAAIETDLAAPRDAIDPTALGEPGLAPAPVAPRPPDAPAATPGALPERPRGGIKGLPRISPPTAGPQHGLDDPAPTEPGFGPGGPTVAPGTADPATSPDDPYAYVDPSTEDPDAVPGSGVVADEPDPALLLATRAVAAYRQRLQRWLSTHFVVTDSGLSKDALRRAVIRAKLEIADDRTVAGYTIEPGGHPAVEAGARRALEAVIGKTVPELPAHYPGPLQRWVRVSFVCSEEKCD